jgi:hypothetical protein
MAEDLWPENIAESNLVTPVSILKEQAALLGEKTQQLVKAEVDTQAAGDNFVHTFYIVAPTLSYRYQLFEVDHGVSFYPINVLWRQEPLPRKYPDEQSFRAVVKQIFASKSTLNVVHSILAQVRS